MSTIDQELQDFIETGWKVLSKGDYDWYRQWVSRARSFFAP